MPMPALPFNPQVSFRVANFPTPASERFVSNVSIFVKNAVEPMQVDVSEENENAEEEPYIVENPTMVSCLKLIVEHENAIASTSYQTNLKFICSSV